MGRELLFIGQNPAGFAAGFAEAVVIALILSRPGLTAAAVVALANEACSRMSATCILMRGKANDKVAALRGPVSKAEFNQLSVRLELQADSQGDTFSTDAL